MPAATSKGGSYGGPSPSAPSSICSACYGIAALILAFQSRAQLEGTLPGCVASRRDSAPQIEASPMAGLLSLPRRIGANRLRRRWINTQRAYLRHCPYSNVRNPMTDTKATRAKAAAAVKASAQRGCRSVAHDQAAPLPASGSSQAHQRQHRRRAPRLERHLAADAACGRASAARPCQGER